MMEVGKILPSAPHRVLSALHVHVCPSSGIFPAAFVATHITSAFGQLFFCLFICLVEEREGGKGREKL